MRTVKLSSGQLRSLINEEVNRLDEAPKKKLLKKRPPSARANVQGSLSDVVMHISHALADSHGAILQQEIMQIMKEMVKQGTLSVKELNHMSVAYLQRLDWTSTLKKNLVPELADMIAFAASELRRYDPNNDE